jgi:hypothetical protein
MVLVQKHEDKGPPVGGVDERIILKLVVRK